MTSSAPSVLVVCRANVCRSRLAAWQLEQALDSAGRADAVEVISRGTHAGTAREACPRIAAGRQITGPSHGLTDEDVRHAGLIVTADRECRGDVVKRSPDAAARTFTLREAAALIAGIDTRGDVADGLAGLVRALNAGRGLVPVFGQDTIALARRGLRRRSIDVHLQDIPDAHSDVAGVHDVIELLTPPAVQTIADALARVDTAAGQR